MESQLLVGVFLGGTLLPGWGYFGKPFLGGFMALTDTVSPGRSAQRTASAMAAGFIFRSLPLGASSGRWKYRHDGREKLMALGIYPDVSLSLARERHAAARKLLATGTDPMAERKAEKAAAENAFQSVARLWMAHWRDGKSPRHVDYVKRRMDADILPCLGARPITASCACAQADIPPGCKLDISGSTGILILIWWPRSDSNRHEVALGRF